MEPTVEQAERGTLRFRLPADELAAERIRRRLEDLDDISDPDTVELLKLAASELVTNAVLHSGARDSYGDVVVLLRTSAPSLLLKVCDRGSGVTESVRLADPMSEGGRGLFLVDAVSRSWGTSTVDIDGAPWSCVWACFGADALPCGEAV